jgi:uncharacterized membrane protein YedE/YeeE
MNGKAKKQPKPYANSYVAGGILGVVLFLAFFLTGSGLGASGPLNRVLVYFENLIAPLHINMTPYLLAMAGGDKNPLDNPFVPLGVGVLVGGFLSGWLHHRLNFTTDKGPRITVKTRWVMAFIGGAFMGYGARFARGCTSGQGLSGGAVLSVGSWAFLMAVFAAAFGLAYTFRRLWN